MTYDLNASPGESTQQAHEQYPKQEHFLEESLGLELQPWEPLKELGLEELGKWLLELAHGVNNSVLNTGYCAWERVLTYRLEDGSGYQGVQFRTHGDFGHKNGGTTYLHRYVKVVRFYGSDALRVRFITERSTLDNIKPPYLVGLYEQDFTEQQRYLDSRDKLVAFEICGHLLSGSFRFTDVERNHPVEPPMRRDVCYQTSTWITTA